MPNINQLCGWAPTKESFALPRKTFQQAAPNLANLWQGEEIGLWNAAKQINGGQNLPADKQTIGDCVSHGYGRGVDYLYCVKEAAGLASGYQEGQTSAMTEYIYGCSRETGGGLGPQDGSTGIWAINGLKKFGYVQREGKGYDGNLAKSYGYRGAPAELKQKGTTHLLEDFAELQEPQDMANALKAGQPCPICSDQGFTMERDSNGACKAQGTWNHCMLVIGMYKVAADWFFVILQSWGQNTPSGTIPTNLAFPDNAFGCHWDTMGRILRQHDSFALCGLKGWEPMPPLNWIM